MLTSIKLNKSPKSFLIGVIKEEVDPSNDCITISLASLVSLLIKSLIDSAWIKSNLLCIKLLEEYSPLVAILAPFFKAISIISLKIKGLP